MIIQQQNKCGTNITNEIYKNNSLNESSINIKKAVKHEAYIVCLS